VKLVSRSDLLSSILGSVTKVTTIPNTSLFLTGSKDGDVKLWDAKNSQLVFHWTKMHERHTFFQPTSRGFGGVVRVCSTVKTIKCLMTSFINFVHVMVREDSYITFSFINYIPMYLHFAGCCNRPPGVA
jgi:WD40 repeat protein